MPTALAQKTCTPCRGGVPPLTAEQAEEHREQVPEWTVMDGATRIERGFRFRNFAEAEGHHPDVSFGWSYATVSLRTKKIKGLHENDFIVAAKLDGIGAEMQGA